MWINCLVELFKGKHNESLHASKTNFSQNSATLSGSAFDRRHLCGRHHSQFLIRRDKWTFKHHIQNSQYYVDQLFGQTVQGKT